MVCLLNAITVTIPEQLISIQVVINEAIIGFARTYCLNINGFSHIHILHLYLSFYYYPLTESKGFPSSSFFFFRKNYL
jgi:hypothetical protein